MNMKEKLNGSLRGLAQDKSTLIAAICLAAALLVVGYQALVSIGDTIQHLIYLFEGFEFRLPWLWDNVVVWFWNAFVVTLLWDLAYLALPAGLLLNQTKYKVLFPIGLLAIAVLSFFGMFGGGYSFVFPTVLSVMGNVIYSLAMTAGFGVIGLHYFLDGKKLTTLFKYIAAGVVVIFHGLNYLFYCFEAIVIAVNYHTGLLNGIVDWFNTSVGYLVVLLVVAAVVFYNPFKTTDSVAEDAPVAVEDQSAETL